MSEPKLPAPTDTPSPTWWLNVDRFYETAHARAAAAKLERTNYAQPDIAMKRREE